MLTAFIEPCDGCSSFCQIDTQKDALLLGISMANIGDKVYCTQCRCVGTIIELDGQQALKWEEMCQSCVAILDERLNALAHKIYQLVNAEDNDD